MQRDAFARALFHIINVAPDFAKELAVRLTTRTLDAGEALIEAGKDPGKIYAIYGVEGRLGIYRKNDTGESEIPGTAIDGSRAVTVGEITMHQRVRSPHAQPEATATVRATQPTTLQMVEISQEQYAKLIHPDSRYRRWVVQAITTTMQRRLKQNANLDFITAMKPLIDTLCEGKEDVDLETLILQLRSAAGTLEERKHVEKLIGDLRLYMELTDETAAYRPQENGASTSA